MQLTPRVHHVRCPYARETSGAMLLDLLDPPGQCSGCWPRDGEVDGCAVEISVLSESGWGDD